MKQFLLSFLICLAFSSKIFAITWDEPWAADVIKKSTSFVLARIVESDEKKGITIEILKTVGGKELTGTILINNFYSLFICSRSGDHGPEFQTQQIDSCYFFIAQNDKAEYCIATPSTGFDYVLDGQVSATYRISIHQAQVPVTLYEKTMSAIFNHYHSIAYDKAEMIAFVKENLAKKPAGFGEDELSIFFQQHVAMELVYHLNLSVDAAILFPFLHDPNNFHNQVSAARALRSINTDLSRNELIKVVGDTTKRGFVQLMAIWSLADVKDKTIKPRLIALEKIASDESDDFTLNIMDSRICTNIPSPKRALKELIEKF